jgi:Xaa-Pro dipeptidase
VEPGCYINSHLLAPFKNSPLIDHAKVEEYMYVGGVRIEDNLLVTENGYDNLTPASLPKTVAQIEKLTARR